MKCLWFLAALSLFSDPIVSIYAVRSSTGEVLIDQNSNLNMTPASCMKVITTAAALHLLGEESRFETELEYDGFIDNHTLYGNLYIRGGGDPCLGIEWEKQLQIWTAAIRKLGIANIEGQVIGDANAWEKALAVPSWNWEDLGNSYGAGACALSFHENSYSLFFKPSDKVGGRATLLRTFPPQFELALQNEVTTGPVGSGDQACIYGSEFSHLQFVRGTIPAAVEEFAIRGAIPDPPRYCAKLLEKTLKENSIAIAGRQLASGQRIKFHTTYSPTIQEIVHQTNQRSMNLYAEHLLKKMGGGSTAAGIKAVVSFWKSVGIEGFNMLDGSGLSRSNFATAKQFVALLLNMQKSPHFSTFFNSLPKQKGSIRAKSGSMSLVKGYVGYANDVVFAILINQCPDRQWKDKTIADFFELIQR